MHAGRCDPQGRRRLRCCLRSNCGNPELMLERFLMERDSRRSENGNDYEPRRWRTPPRRTGHTNRTRKLCFGASLGYSAAKALSQAWDNGAFSTSEGQATKQDRRQLTCAIVAANAREKVWFTVLAH